MFLSCETAVPDFDGSDGAKVVEASSASIALDRLELHDQVKVVVARALEKLMIENAPFREELLPLLVDADREAVDFLYIQHKTRQMQGGQTLEEAFESVLTQEEKRVLSQSDEAIPNLVIKIPDWANTVIQEIGLSNLAFKVIAGLRVSQQEIALRSPAMAAEAIPIEIKESEKVVPVERNSTQTFWGDDLMRDHLLPAKDCPVGLAPYTVYEGSQYRYIDKVAMNEDLLEGHICGASLPSSATGSEGDCEREYGRDCEKEKNVIEGFKLNNNAVFLGINNQPGGEDVISLHYNFVASQMCGDLTVPADCPPTQWKFVFFGTINDFYEIQVHSGSPATSELADVIFVGDGYYVKSFPSYYDIPVDMSFENIYSQAPYLISTGNSTWDGNIYGSVVSFSIYEHDDVIVKETASKSMTVTNVANVSASLGLGEDFNTGADFSNTVTRTSTYTYNIEAEKDVELGQNAVTYFDENYASDNFYGINKSTGSVITHFAFYTE